MGDIFKAINDDFALQIALDAFNLPSSVEPVIDPSIGQFDPGLAQRYQPGCPSCKYLGRYIPRGAIMMGYLQEVPMKPADMDVFYDPEKKVFLAMWGPHVTPKPTQHAIPHGSTATTCWVGTALVDNFPSFHPLAVAAQAAAYADLYDPEED